MSLRGKKVCCFVALPHHSRFMWPVMEEARKAGADTLFFTTLADYPFERDVMRRGVECRLLQSYATAETRRRITATTDEFFGRWRREIMQWDGLKHWPMTLQSSLLTAGFEEYHCLDEFMRVEQPDLLLALHERNRWGKLMGHMARKYGVAYLTLQEGDYYEDRLSFCAHTEYTTALMLWGEDTAARLERHGSARNKMVSIGNTHLAQVGSEYFTAKHRQAVREELGIPKGKKVVLFLVGLQWGVVKNIELWQNLLKGLGDDVVKIFKWHPKVTAESFRKDYRDRFKEVFPSCIVVQNYEPYSLLAVADYCVALGKTTLGVEALCFGRPLFSRTGLDGTADHYVAQGIAQSVDQGWESLYRTLEHGVPTEIQQNVDGFMERFFHRRNHEAMPLARQVMEVLLNDYPSSPRVPAFQRAAVPGRVSFVVAGGDDSEALLATIISLAEKVQLPDWEAVVVLSDSALREALAPVAGDLVVVEAEGQGLGALYNRGANASSGDTLVFLRAGLLYYKDDDFYAAAAEGVAGMPIRHVDMTPYCLGLHYNFNSDPGFATRDDLQVQGVGGGILGCARAVFVQVGGFDADIANHLVEADFCLAASGAGIGVFYQQAALALHIGDGFYDQDRHEPAWPRRLRFFAKWRGRLPKDEDFMGYAGPYYARLDD